MTVDSGGLTGIKSQTKIYLSQINLDDTSRKSHNKILYELASLFRTTRGIAHARVVIN